MREILARIIGLVNHSFAGRAAVQVRLAEILSDASVYKVEVRHEEAASALAAARASIFGTIRDARGVVAGARAAVEADVDRITAATPEQIAEARARLLPGLTLSSSRPRALIDLYRERHRNNAERRVLEEAVSVLIDALGPDDESGFGQEWHSLRLGLAAQRSPEELEALGMLEVLGDEATDERVGAGAYLDAAESLLNIDLQLMDPSFEGDRDALGVGRAFSESTVNRFENEHAPQHVV